MKKNLVLLFFCLPIFNVVFAQAPDHSALMNKYWDLLATRTIKKTPGGKYEPYIPASLAAINSKIIHLPGYMIPLKTASVHKTFLISVLPILQCQYCGQGDVPEMVEVFMTEPIKFSTKPITVEGVLNINESLDGATFQLLNARIKQ